MRFKGEHYKTDAGEKAWWARPANAAHYCLFLTKKPQGWHVDVVLASGGTFHQSGVATFREAKALAISVFAALTRKEGE
jgi:hypothetical protein